MNGIRKLKQFMVTESLGDGIEMDSIITIAGVYEPTKWERRRSRLTYPFRWLLRHTFGLQIYFSNLWDAICGRCDGF